jgi:hypothetical protein
VAFWAFGGAPTVASSIAVCGLFYRRYLPGAETDLASTQSSRFIWVEGLAKTDGRFLVWAPMERRTRPPRTVTSNWLAHGGATGGRITGEPLNCGILRPVMGQGAAPPAAAARVRRSK